ncbi:DUF4192 family protein [Kineococcus sp. R8]|uniref:DUF4192 domain-containing protein n=1 Tax=Kineococcus siccus TaxID=2696567 RepID=UPI0014120704|nr:DUF4192 domain-containing protein [Kineococcus siccus]NAZ81091.1 DUF4192 family protein [Kineococcus siccus]
MPPAPPPSSADPPARVLTLTGPGDLLAALPYRLGFHPRQSLVLLELRATGAVVGGGARHRLGACVRADLPVAVAEVDRVAQAVLAPWQRGTAAGPVVLVVYADDGSVGDGPGPVTALLRCVEALLGRAGVDVHDVLVVGPFAWRSLRCADAGCCPARERSVAQLASGPVAAEAVLRGLVAAPSRAALAPLLAALPEVRVRSARRALSQAQHLPWTPGRRRAVLQLWATVRARYEGDHGGARPGDLPSPESCGRLLAGLGDVAVRDAVLLDAVPGSPARAAAAGLLAGSGPGVLADRLAQALATAPDPRRAEAGARLAVDLARHAGAADGSPVAAADGDGDADGNGDADGGAGEGALAHRSAAGALAVAAWSWWSTGDGVRAGGCAEAALVHDARQSLALLVARAVEQGLPPAWQQPLGRSPGAQAARVPG